MFTMTWNYPSDDIEFDIGDVYDTLDDAHKSISKALADWLATDHGDLTTILNGIIVIKDSEGDLVFEKPCHRMRLNRDIPSDARLIKIMSEHHQNVDETAALIEKITNPWMPDPLSLMKLIEPSFYVELKAA